MCPCREKGIGSTKAALHTLRMADSLDPTAGEEEPSGWQDVNTPDYLKEVTDSQFVNISIKGYEKKSSSGFPREEYYAFHIVSMYGK